MASALWRTGLLTLRIGFWGGMTYGTIMPAYHLARGLEEMRQLIRSTRQDLEGRRDIYSAGGIKGIVHYVQGKEKEREQKVIRQFHRNIEDKLGVDCDHDDNKQYKLPELRRVGNGKYELLMECDGKTLVAPLGKVEWR